ncbi:MAG: zf-HC2 domain-containing protein [Armatimonadetes bacterium]|nr:zf-HC2 domain-containing protein [Armatimonadota bacterium]
MSCSRIQRILSAYVDSELDGREMLAVRGHLRECAECRRYFDRLAMMKRLFSYMPCRRPDPDSIERVTLLLRSATPESRNSLLEILQEWLYSARRPGWIAGMAAGLAVGMMLFASPAHEPPSRQTATLLRDYLMRHSAFPFQVDRTPGGAPDVLSGDARLYMVEVGFRK